MNYTKGEWRINETTSCPTKITALGGFVIASANKRVDAHLIAAAPAMYEALKAVMNYLEAPYPINVKKWKPIMAKAVEEALSQAEGK